MKYKIWIIIFFFVITGTNAFAVAEEKTWSFEFEKISVPDALNKMSEVSGIDINIDGEIDNRKLTTFYKDYSIENILRDIFSGKNIAVLLRYKEKKLTVVDIRILPDAGKENQIVVSRKSIRQAADTLPRQGHEKVKRFQNPFERIATEGTAGINQPSENDTGNTINENPFTKARSNLNSEGKMTNPFVSPDNGNSADISAPSESVPNPFKKIENPDSDAEE